jgi:hypothetical protein
MKIVFGDDNIHLFSCVVREKMKNLFLYVNSTLQCDSCNDILKHIMGFSVFIPARAAYQMDTQIINGVTTLASWKM